MKWRGSGGGGGGIIPGRTHVILIFEDNKCFFDMSLATGFPYCCSKDSGKEIVFHFLS